MQFTQIIIIVAAAIGTTSLLVASEKRRRVLLYIGIFSIVVGQRGVYIGQRSNIVPFEAIILALFFFLPIYDSIYGKQIRIKLPFSLIFVTVWCVLAGLLAWIEGTSMDQIFVWTFPLVIGVPTFYVVRRLIRKGEQFEITLNILIAVSIIMSLLAIIEYVFPGISNFLPGVFTKAYDFTPDGFVRATFSFWGYPAGAIIVTWGMLVSYQRIITYRKFKRIIWYLAVFILGGAAVYISGQRGSWIGLILAILLLSLPGKIKGWIGVTLIGVATLSFPAVFWQRVNTLTAFAETGVPVDGSTAQRLARWRWGIDEILKNPLSGYGYGHWLTHNAFLEIGSTLGVIPAIVFLIFIVQLIVRILKAIFNNPSSEARNYGWLFLAIAVTWMIQINVETVFQTHAIAVAFWPYMALAWYLPDLFRTESKYSPTIQNSGSTIT